MAGDGDPIDVLLLMDEPAFPGISVMAHLIGVIEGEQIEERKRSGTIDLWLLLKPIMPMPRYAS